MQDDQVEATSLVQKRYFSIEQSVFIVLMILSFIGLVITDFSQHDGYGYWMFMVLVFGALSIFVSWLQAKQNASSIANIVKVQGLHWFHTLIIVGVSSLLNRSGELTELSASLVTLLILALATMLDGMRIGWQFSLLGFFLASCTLIIVYVEDFIWVCGGLAGVLVIGTLFWGYWLHSHSAEDKA